jgi:hypothetical protein
MNNFKRCDSTASPDGPTARRVVQNAYTNVSCAQRSTLLVVVADWVIKCRDGNNKQHVTTMHCQYEGSGLLGQWYSTWGSRAPGGTRR